MITDVKDELVRRTLNNVNDRLKDGIRFEYFGRDTESGSARIVKYDRHGDLGLVAVGSPRECWQFAQGLVAAMTTLGR